MLRMLIAAALITSAGVAIAPAAQASGPYKNCKTVFSVHLDARWFGRSQVMGQGP